MSHSTVMVVIRDAQNIDQALEKIPELLAPFDENKEMDPTVQPLSDEEVGHAVDFYREHPEFCDGTQGPVKPFDQYVTEGNLEAWNEWKRQAVGHYHAGGASNGSYVPSTDTFGYESTYNPQSKWDWWSIGGRWHGFFQVRPGVAVGAEEIPAYRLAMGPVGDNRVEGVLQIEQFDPAKHAAFLGGSGTGGDEEGENFEGRADVARKGDIDFEAMRALAGQQAEIQYDKFEIATEGIEPIPSSFRELVDLRAAEAGLDPNDNTLPGVGPFMDGVRKEYHEHPWIVALAKADLKPWFDDARDVYFVGKGGREAFVEAARASTTSTFAVLIDGEWHERGSMGWFGIVSDEKDADGWRAQQARLVEGLSDDTYLAVVDVHI